MEIIGRPVTLMMDLFILVLELEVQLQILIPLINLGQG